MLAPRVSLAIVALLVLAVTSCVFVPGCGGGGGGAGVLATVLGNVREGDTLDPIKGAVVKVGARSSGPTDGAGAFTVRNVPAGTQTLTTVAPGYETGQRQIVLAQGNNNIGRVYMARGAISGKGHIAGVVRDGGVPVASAVVKAGDKTARSKADGTVAIYNLPPGPVSVRAEAGGRTGITVLNVVDGATAHGDINMGIAPPGPPAI